MTIASAANSSGCCAGYSSKEPPNSSSPSMMTRSVHGASRRRRAAPRRARPPRTCRRQRRGRTCGRRGSPAGTARTARHRGSLVAARRSARRAARSGTRRARDLAVDRRRVVTEVQQPGIGAPRIAQQRHYGVRRTQHLGPGEAGEGAPRDLHEGCQIGSRPRHVRGHPCAKLLGVAASAASVASMAASPGRSRAPGATSRRESGTTSAGLFCRRRGRPRRRGAAEEGGHAGPGLVRGEQLRRQVRGEREGV